MSRAGRAAPGRWLWAAALLAGALVLEGLASFLWAPAGSADVHILTAFMRLADNEHLHSAARWLRAVATPATYAAIGAVLAAIALARRRARLGVLVVLGMLGASATTELLKHIVAGRPSRVLAPGVFVGPTSWPSGHATAAMMAALCLVIVAPAALRPLAALCGSALAIAVGYALLVLAAHYPSDVLGGYLVAAAWACALAAGYAYSEARWPSRAPARASRATRRPHRVPAALAAAAVGAVAVLEGVRPVHATVGGWLMAGAIAIALLAASMTAGLSSVLGARAYGLTRLPRSPFRS